MTQSRDVNAPSHGLARLHVIAQIRLASDLLFASDMRALILRTLCFAILALGLSAGCAHGEAASPDPESSDDYDQQAWASGSADTTGIGPAEGYYGAGASGAPPSHQAANPSRGD